MKNSLKKGFTLVELLVVITILSIISVVAYQSFSGATSSAVSARKLSDVTTIESSLQQYKITNNNYPKVDEYDANTNMWGYDSSKTASASNTLVVGADDMNGDTIKSFTASTSTATGGGKVYGLAPTGGTDYSSKQIAAKGTISQETLGKQFLTKDLYDPELGDTPVGSGKLLDYGVGRYVYAVYTKPLSGETNWTTNKQGSYYNIAYTIKKEETDSYETVITGDYDSASCKGVPESCPETLIGSGTNILTHKSPQSNSDTNLGNQGIPYPLINYTR